MKKGQHLFHCDVLNIPKQGVICFSSQSHFVPLTTRGQGPCEVSGHFLGPGARGPIVQDEVYPFEVEGREAMLGLLADRAPANSPEWMNSRLPDVSVSLTLRPF